MRQFNFLTIEQYEKHIATCDPKRDITHIQIHHTLRPTLEQYNRADDREKVIFGMYNYHVSTLGQSDIAQHFTPCPDGIWDGRPITSDPGGFKGERSNRGGICFEIVGDFDIGRERLEGSHRANVVRAVRACLKRWPNAAIVFHREKDPTKSCPGSGLRKDWFMDQLKRATFEEVLIKCSTSPDAQKAAISSIVALAEAKGDIGMLEILKHLPELLVKAYEAGKEGR